MLSPWGRLDTVKSVHALPLNGHKVTNQTETSLTHILVLTQTLNLPLKPNKFITYITTGDFTGINYHFSLCNSSAWLKIGMLKATDGYCWVSFPTVAKSSVPVARFSRPRHDDDWVRKQWVDNLCGVSKWHKWSEIWKWPSWYQTIKLHVEILKLSYDHWISFVIWYIWKNLFNNRLEYTWKPFQII